MWKSTHCQRGKAEYPPRVEERRIAYSSVRPKTSVSSSASLRVDRRTRRDGPGRRRAGQYGCGRELTLSEQRPTAPPTPRARRQRQNPGGYVFSIQRH